MIKNELEWSRDFKFGIELEIKTELSQDKIVELLKAEGLKAYKVCSNIHSTKRGWKVVYDGSVNNGWEIVSPPLCGLDKFDEVAKVCKVLADIGATIDLQCGFHVHHDISDITNIQSIKNIYEIYSKFEDGVICNLIPSNRSMGYSHPITPYMEDLRTVKSLDELLDHRKFGGRGDGNGHYGSCRYKTVNIRSYIKYGTVEFRHHEGTTNFEDIKYWVMLTHKIIETACIKKTIRKVSNGRKQKWLEEVRKSSYDFYKELGINGTELSQYLGKRRKKIV